MSAPPTRFSPLLRAYSVEDLAALAREILDQRLARGEIAPEQYDQLREKLDATSAPSDPRPANSAGVSG